MLHNNVFQRFQHIFNMYTHYSWSQTALLLLMLSDIVVPPVVSCPLVMAAAVAGAKLAEGNQLEVQLILQLPGLFT